MSTRTRDDTVARVRELLSPERHVDRLRRMSPEARALDESIEKLRKEIGPIDFEVVTALRELRQNG